MPSLIPLEPSPTAHALNTAHPAQPSAVYSAPPPYVPLAPSSHLFSFLPLPRSSVFLTPHAPPTVHHPTPFNLFPPSLYLLTRLLSVSTHPHPYPLHTPTLTLPPDLLVLSLHPLPRFYLYSPPYFHPPTLNPPSHPPPASCTRPPTSCNSHAPAPPPRRPPLPATTPHFPSAHLFPQPPAPNQVFVNPIRAAHLTFPTLMPLHPHPIFPLSCPLASSPDTHTSYPPHPPSPLTPPPPPPPPLTPLLPPLSLRPQIPPRPNPHTSPHETTL